jgi:FkbM family methyltransferase
MSNFILRSGRFVLDHLVDRFGLKIVPKESGVDTVSTANNNLVISGNGLLSEKFFVMQKTLKPDYAIEVGAHAAEFSVTVSNYFGIKATAFEAGQSIYETYKDRIKGDLVKYVNSAVSDIDGTVSFKVEQNELFGNNGIVKRNGTYPLSEKEVQSHRLDTYFENIDFSNACLWIDVEGASRQVLTGGLKTLQRVSSVFIETEDHPYWEDQWLTLDVVKFLNSQGFALEDSEKVYEAQQNLLFVRKLGNN